MEIPLRCSCGQVKGRVLNAPKDCGPRGVCLCDDCQAYAHYLGRAQEILDASGGTEVVPVAPANLKFTQGQEQIKVLRLSPKGMLRWYAGCCNTAIGNSPPSPRLPFLGLVHTILDRQLSEQKRNELAGPIKGRMFGKYGIAPLPEGTHQGMPFPFLARTIPFFLKGLIKSAHTPSPFFDDATHQPTREPYVLTREERDKLRPLCGPK